MPCPPILSICPVLLSFVDMIKNMTKRSMGREGLIRFTYANLSPSPMNAKTGTKAEGMEEWHLLACSPWPVHFLITTKMLARGYRTHSKLGPPTSIFNNNNTKENASTDFPTGNVMEVFSQLRFHFPDNSTLSDITQS